MVPDMLAGPRLIGGLNSFLILGTPYGLSSPHFVGAIAERARYADSRRMRA